MGAALDITKHFGNFFFGFFGFFFFFSSRKPLQTLYNNPFLDTLFIFSTKNPDDPDFWSDLGF